MNRRMPNGMSGGVGAGAGNRPRLPDIGAGRPAVHALPASSRLARHRVPTGRTAKFQ